MRFWWERLDSPFNRQFSVYFASSFWFFLRPPPLLSLSLSYFHQLQSVSIVWWIVWFWSAELGKLTDWLALFVHTLFIIPVFFLLGCEREVAYERVLSEFKGNHLNVWCHCLFPKSLIFGFCVDFEEFVYHFGLLGCFYTQGLAAIYCLFIYSFACCCWKGISGFQVPATCDGEILSDCCVWFVYLAQPF